MFIFWICLPFMRANTWSLYFCIWLISFNMMSSNCIHYLQTIRYHYSLRLCKTPFTAGFFLSIFK
jgi:hypothetical protein